jgi:hypothetical protein
LKSAEAVTLEADLVFRDPYVLDFLGLSDTYNEQNQESANLTQIEVLVLNYLRRPCFCKYFIWGWFHAFNDHFLC